MLPRTIPNVSASPLTITGGLVGHDAVGLLLARPPSPGTLGLPGTRRPSPCTSVGRQQAGNDKQGGQDADAPSRLQPR